MELYLSRNLSEDVSSNFRRLGGFERIFYDGDFHGEDWTLAP